MFRNSFTFSVPERSILTVFYPKPLLNRNTVAEQQNHSRTPSQKPFRNGKTIAEREKNKPFRNSFFVSFMFVPEQFLLLRKTVPEWKIVRSGMVFLAVKTAKELAVPQQFGLF